MDTHKVEQIVSQQLLICRIIHLALVASVAGFLVFAIVAPAANFEAALPHVEWSFAAVGIVTALGGWVVPWLIVGRFFASPASATAAQGHSEDRDARLALSTLQSAMIVGWAMFEGGAIANLMWYYSHKNPLNLAIGIVLLISLLLRFPSRSGMLDKVEARLRRHREARELGA